MTASTAVASTTSGSAGSAGTAGPVRSASDTELLTAGLVPRRRTGQWLSAALALVVVAFAVQSAVRNPRFEWSLIWEYLRAPDVARGLWLTGWLTAAVMGCGFLLGIGVAAMRMSANPVLRSVAFGYVWLFRSVPILLQLLFWYELASLYPRLSIGIPFGPEFAGTGTATLISALLAAFIALTLDVGAFASEIVRGGLLSVPRGQVEAAQSLGLSGLRIFRRIVLPQAMPAIVPASGNLLIGTVKATAFVSVIAVSDLLYSIQLIYGQNYQIMPMLIVAAIWYLVLNTILSIGQHYVERHYLRSTRTFRQTMWQNLPLFGKQL